MLFFRYSGRSVNKDHVRYLKAHRKVGLFLVDNGGWCTIKFKKGAHIQ